MREGSGKGVLLAAMLLTTVTLSVVYSQEWPLKVEIKKTPTVVSNKRAFILDMTIQNTSDTEQVLQTYQCSYGDWHWTTDNPAVHVQTREVAHCKKNALVYIKLKPGEAYETALPIRASLSAREIMVQSVTFRIGLQVRLGYNLSTEPPPYIWSAPITIRVE